MGKDVKTYKVLYLPTGDYIRSIYTIGEGKPCLWESEEVAFKFIVSLCRSTRPEHDGLMSYNSIIFPSISNHFHIVESP